jgi:heat shock protein HtpX
MAIRLVENLAISQGMKTPKIFVIDDNSMNAFATGRKEENATIVFTKGLLDNLEKKEIEGVAAHELSHIKNKDIMIMTISVALIGVIAIISDMAIRMVFFSNEKKHPAFYIIAIALGILAPIAAKLIQLSISRKREFLADSSAVLMTRFPDGLSSALEKISGQNIPLKKQSTAVAHLYISNPAGKKASFFGKIFSTHPPVQERIEALNNMGK